MEIRNTSQSTLKSTQIRNKTSAENSGKDALDIKDNFSYSSEPEKDENFYLKSIAEGFKRKENVEDNKRIYNRNLIYDSIDNGVVGGGIGFILLNKILGPVGSVAAGVSAGVFLAWDKLHSQDKGQVTIEIDGNTFVKPYYMNPKAYEKAPGEEEMIARTIGDISYNIPPLNLKPEDIQADMEKTSQLKPYAETLKGLGKDRRLLASFGKKSSDGKEVLHLIDSNMAKNLIASGKSVFVLDVTDLKDIPHNYSTHATNKNRTVYEAKSFDFLEKKLDYSLSEIKKPENLGNMKEGKGLPEGFYGVYKDGNSCSEVVYDQNQSGDARLWKSDGTSHEKFNYNKSEHSKIESNNFEKAIESLNDKIPDELCLKMVKYYLRTSPEDQLDEKLKVLQLDSKQLEAVRDVINAKYPVNTRSVKPKQEMYRDFSRWGALAGVAGGYVASIAMGGTPYALAILAGTGFAGYKIGKYMSHKLRVGAKIV